MKLSGQPALVAYLEVQQVLPVEYSATLQLGDFLHVAMQLSRLVPQHLMLQTHADWAYFLAAHKFSSGQVLHDKQSPGHHKRRDLSKQTVS